GAPAVIRKTDWKTPELADLYCACSDVECGHTFVCTMTFSHTLSPGARSGRNMVKFLVDAMRPEDRRYALELLSRRS
ncbi:ogr/Delta-like zinc finger family protein, partial [Escherichia coli]|nr:ogr/Delta-like zinc finger family protein [Escherichia coli]